MDKSQKVLSDVTVFMKYAKYIPELKRRETWEELVERNKTMHTEKFPFLKQEIDRAYQLVLDKKVLPSMRSMQFAGKPIKVNPTRIYNCCALPIDDWRAFQEVMFLLLSGTGVGFSVQKHHVEQLPEINKPNPDRTRRFLIGDSIEGWADSIRALMRSYFNGGPTVRFDFSDIRPKGARLLTAGGKAPGPAPLKECLVKMENILAAKKDGEKLTPIEVFDLICHIADAVLAGGIRRAALICLFSADDDEMIAAKSGSWWELNPQRGRSNNSAMLLRHKATEPFFKELWKKIELSKAGEPGIYFSNDKEWLTNPCVEIALRSFQFCNLTEINASTIESQEDFEQRARAAALIGTLQASYTDFHYLRPIWKKTTERDALLGVSMTGIASMKVFEHNIDRAATAAVQENRRIAKLIGVNEAARITCVKPAGTTSLTLGTSSGIHAWHDRYYIRRIRVGKNESLYTYLSIYHPGLVKDEVFRAHDTAVIEVPQKAPKNAVTRAESAMDLLERVKEISQRWVRPGHMNGNNSHNVSATITIKPDEWELVGDWMWRNKDFYNGLSVLPEDGGTYTQAPFETITEEKYNELIKTLEDVDLTKVVEMEDVTDLKSEAACVGGQCEVV